MSEPVLQVKGLKTYYYTEEGVVPAVDGLDFEVEPGETFAIVGESGCGKSVTSLSILRLIPSPPGKIIDGEIIYHGQDLVKKSEREMRSIRGNDISMIFQEPMTSLNPVFTVGQQIGESFRFHQQMGKAEMLKKSIEMLRLVGIPEPEHVINDYPNQLSGGMRQRVMIAMALACNPKILHDSRHGAAAQPDSDGLPVRAALRVCDGALPSGNAAIDARQRQAERPLLPGGGIGAEGGERAVSEGKIILKAEDVRTYFPVKGALGQTVKEVKAVDGVSLALRQGETYGLVGESGCGKSTLGRTLIRLLEPTSGKITLFDQDITHLSKKEMLPFRRDVQIVFQDPYTSLNPRQRVGDMLMEVLAIHHIGDKNERMARALDIMAQVGLRPEHFYRYPHEFSGGQRQRIGLARALILDPKIVVCDEPVSALDVSIQSQIINLLKELQRKRGLTYLFVAHDMSVIRYISDRVGVMYLGHLVEEGDTDEVFDHPQHPYTRTLMSAVPSIDPRDNRQRILLEGDLPSPIDPPSGCVFHTRCPWATEACKTASCELREVRAGHYAACSRGEQE